MVVVIVVVQRSTQYKGITDRHSPTRPSEAVRVAILLLRYLLIRDIRTVKWKAPHHPSLPPAEADRKRKG